jgi:hypothetical protein
MLEILGLVAMAYIAFGAVISLSPLMRDGFALAYRSRTPTDKWRNLAARVAAHVGLVFAWPGLLPGASESVEVPIRHLVKAIRRTLHSYWSPNTLVRTSLMFAKEAERGVASLIRPKNSSPRNSFFTDMTGQPFPSRRRKRKARQVPTVRKWKSATLAAELGVPEVSFCAFASLRGIDREWNLSSVEAAGLALAWVENRPGICRGPIAEAAAALLDTISGAPTA